MSSKPTVVIAHGAWQTVVTFAAFAEQLESLGHTTEVVPFPSIDGNDTPVPGLREDAEAVANVLARHADQGKEIVLLCHSYGGVVGSCAVEGLDLASRKKAGKVGGVIMTIYLSAFMLPKGKSLLEMLGGQPLPWMDVQGDKVYPVPSMVNEVAFNDISPEKAAIYSGYLTHASTAAFATPSTYEPWSNGVPCAYIFCEIDGAVPLPVQQQMASQMGPDATTFSLKAGHCPFLSVPDQVIDAVLKASEVGLKKRDS